MSLLPEDKDNKTLESEEVEAKEKTEPEAEEESTIFSAPSLHDDRKKGSGKLKNALLALLALVLVVGIAFGIAYLVPEQGENTSSGAAMEETPLLVLDEEKYSSITLTADKESITFNAVETVSEETSSDDASSEAEVERKWYISGAKDSLISTTKTGSMVKAFCDISYIKKMENPDADYGFDTPAYEVLYVGKDSADNKTLTVGKFSPDSSGRYVKISGDSGIYLVMTDYFEDYSTDALDFADTTGLPALSKSEDYDGEYFSSGTLSTFDTITVKSDILTHEFTFAPNLGEDAFGTYIIKKPVERYANDDNVGALYTIFQNGISGSGVYSFTSDAAALKAFGLDTPEFTATIKAGSDSMTFSATLQSDGSYAVIGDNMEVILKVAASNLAAAAFGDSDYYSALLFIESLLEAKTVEIARDETRHTFAITTESETEEDGTVSKTITSITCDGKEITIENFQGYYGYLVEVPAVEFNFKNTSSMTPAGTIRIKHTDGSADTLIEYFMLTSGRYQMEINGVEIGVISGSNFRNIFEYAENVANDVTFNS